MCAVHYSGFWLDCAWVSLYPERKSEDISAELYKQAKIVVPLLIWIDLCR